MGRITPSFRQLYLEYVKRLKRQSGFQDTLLDPDHRRAFDLLLKEAWSAENAAMANAGIPCITDIMNLMANVHNTKCIEDLRQKILKLEMRIEQLQN